MSRRARSTHSGGIGSLVATSCLGRRASGAHGQGRGIDRGGGLGDRHLHELARRHPRDAARHATAQAGQRDRQRPIARVRSRPAAASSSPAARAARAPADSRDAPRAPGGVPASSSLSSTQRCSGTNTSRSTQRPAAGAGETQHVPVVDDLDVGERHQQIADAGRIAGGAEERADDRPARVACCRWRTGIARSAASRRRCAFGHGTRRQRRRRDAPADRRPRRRSAPAAGYDASSH